MAKRLIVLALLLFRVMPIFSQWVLINEDGGSPDNSAAFEIQATDRGVLIPRMLATERLAIPSPAQGLLVFQTNGTIGFYYHNGSSWDTLGGATTVINNNTVTNITNSNIAVIRDNKAVGVDGGTFTSGSWQQRGLNDLEGDSSFVELSNDTISLDSGTYIFTINAPAFRVDEHQVRLYNCTSGSVEAVGTTAFSGNFASSDSKLIKVVTILSSNQFIVEHRCTTTQTTDGLGQGVSWGENVYTQVQITKL